jgi:hypothetical protein
MRIRESDLSDVRRSRSARIATSLAVFAAVLVAGCEGVSRDEPQGVSAREALEAALLDQSPVTRCNGDCQTFRPTDARCRGEGVPAEGDLIFFQCDITFAPEGNDQSVCVATKTVNGESAFETRATSVCKRA